MLTHAVRAAASQAPLVVGTSGGRARRARRALVRVSSHCARPTAPCPNVQPRAHARLIYTGLTTSNEGLTTSDMARRALVRVLMF